MLKVEKSGLLASGNIYELIEPVVIEMQDETLWDARLTEDVAGKLWFTAFSPTVKDGQIQTKLGLTGAPIVGEFDEFTISKRDYGPKISYDVVRTFVWTPMSSEAKKWLERATNGDISDALVADLKSSMDALQDRANEIMITCNEYVTKVFTQGFSINAEFGPWSATYDGKAFFADDHIVIGTGETYSNIVEDTANAGQHAPLNFANLKSAVNQSRTMKYGNGTRVRRTNVYDLVVSPELEETALDVLSDGNGFMPYNFAWGEATNDNFWNVFSTRDGFKVRLVVLETLNQPDSQNPAENIGSDTIWFLVNKEASMARKAFRDINFGDVTIKIFEDNNKNATMMTAEKHFGAQALYPETVVGSLGDNSAI